MTEILENIIKTGKEMKQILSQEFKLAEAQFRAGISRCSTPVKRIRDSDDEGDQVDGQHIVKKKSLKLHVPHIVQTEYSQEEKNIFSDSEDETIGNFDSTQSQSILKPFIAIKCSPYVAIKSSPKPSTSRFNASTEAPFLLTESQEPMPGWLSPKTARVLFDYAYSENQECAFELEQNGVKKITEIVLNTATKTAQPGDPDCLMDDSEE